MTTVDMPVRCQLCRMKGWHMPPNTVNVSRPGPWGNPFVVGTPLTPDAKTAVRQFREWIVATLDPQHPACTHTRAAMDDHLRGKNLACWCALDQPCHADVLLELANK